MIIERDIADLRTAAVRSFRQPFRIVSTTKGFVAAAILQIVEVGKLRMTDKMARWYSQFPNADSITIDDLLRMRSGIAVPGDNIVPASVYDRPLGDNPNVAEQIAEAAAPRAKVIAPNTKGVHTDLNYFIPGEIARRVTRHDIGDTTSPAASCNRRFRRSGSRRQLALCDHG